MLLFERVSRWYGPVIGVNQITLELRGGITGLVGANGAGKTTLLRLAAGQLRPDMGRVTVLSHDARTTAARMCVGYCPEIDVFYEEMSGRQFVRCMARLIGYTRRDAQDRTEEVLREVGMADRSDRCVRGYSKGMRQRIKLAQALLHDPPLLILDEPLSGIDPVGRRELVEQFLGLAERGKCLLISSHELEELERLTERVAIMARGRIAAVGTVASIRERLEDEPMSIRIDVVRSDALPRPQRSGEMFHVEPSGNENGLCGPAGEKGVGTLLPERPEGCFAQKGPDPFVAGEGRHRELAARLLQLQGVVSVEVLDGDDFEPDVGRLLVRARQPRQFFQSLSGLVIEEWFDLRRLEPLDDSTAAVLGYLLGGHAASD